MQEPGVGATALLGEVRALGCTGSHNLLVRYFNQARYSGTRWIRSVWPRGRVA